VNLDEHHGAEDALLDALHARAREGLGEMRDERLGDFGARGGDERRAAPAGRVGYR
jgi:hypothetical protein